MVQLSDDMSTSFRYSRLTDVFSFTGLISSSVFTESYLQNRIIDKRLSLPLIWAYISVSVFYTIIYIEENKPTQTTTTKKEEKRKYNYILTCNILNMFCYILSTLQIFLGMAVIKNFVFLCQQHKFSEMACARDNLVIKKWIKLKI